MRIALAAAAFLAGMTVATAQPAPAVPAPNLPAPTVADELDFWFLRLAQATSQADAQIAEAQIQRLWLNSGSATVDLVMQRAIEAAANQGYAIALDLLDGIIALQPDYAEAWHRKAIIYFEVEDYAACIAAVERTLELEPRHFGAWAGLGQVLYRMEDRERALLALNRALAIHPYLAGTRELVTELTAALRRDV
jgi:tetratricopeptide (TPR) repeat protein